MFSFLRLTGVAIKISLPQIHEQIYLISAFQWRCSLWHTAALLPGVSHYMGRSDGKRSGLSQYQKRSGSVTLGPNRRRRSRSVMEKCSKPPLCTPKSEGKARMGKSKGGSRKSRHRRFFSPFSTPICTLFRACGLVMGTGDEDCPEALLAGMDTALADLVVPAAAVLPQEEGPLQPPLLAPAHRSCSGGFFC